MPLSAINIWDSIGKVTSGFTLLALVVIAALFAYRIKMAWNLRTLKNSKGNERIRIIKLLSDTYEIDISGLSRTQQYSIVMEQLNQKKQRYLLQIFTFTICMISFSIIAIFSIKYGKEKFEIANGERYNSQNMNAKTPNPYEPSVKLIQEKVKTLINDRSEIINNKSTVIVLNKSQSSNIKTGNERNLYTPQSTEPETLDELIDAIKVTKDKAKLKLLQIKARSILQPRYDFGTINIKTTGTDMVLSKYKFISYNYSSNVLELSLERISYYINPQKLRNTINANIKINLNKKYHLDRDDDNDNTFAITCVESNAGCITFQPINGVCADYIKEPFPECLKIDPVAYYGVSSDLLFFYNNNNKELNKLYTVLKTEHERITSPHP